MRVKMFQPLFLLFLYLSHDLASVLGPLAKVKHVQVELTVFGLQHFSTFIDAWAAFLLVTDRFYSRLSCVDLTVIDGLELISTLVNGIILLCRVHLGQFLEFSYQTDLDVGVTVFIVASIG